MTTAIANFDWSNANTQAAQSAYVNGVKNLLTAAGLVQTTDTGQINVSGGYVAAVSQYFGYQVYKFPDALQASAPIFIRVDFRATNSGALPFVGFTVGTTTDGAGTIGGGATFATANAGTPFAQPYQTGVANYACYVDGTFTCALGVGAVPLSGTSSSNNNGNLGALVVDRQRTTAGVAQGQGFLCEATYQPFTTASASRAIYGAASNLQASIPALIPNYNATTASEGANVNVFRHQMMTPGVHPSLGSLTYLAGDLGAFVPITVTILGAAHTYLPLGQFVNNWSAYPNNGYLNCAAIRWE